VVYCLVLVPDLNLGGILISLDILFIYVSCIIVILLSNTTSHLTFQGLIIVILLSNTTSHLTIQGLTITLFFRDEQIRLVQNEHTAR